MPIKAEKRTTPLMMFLALIAAVMPLSLQAVGIEFSLPQTIGTVIKTYGKAVSFVSCTYQPGLVAEVVTLLNHCEQPKPGEQASPTSDQLACNPEQITIDAETAELCPSTSAEETMNVLAVQMATASPVRARRNFARRVEVEIPTQPSAEVLDVAFAREIEIPQRLVIQNSSPARFEMNFISKPKLSARETNEFTRLVKTSMARGEGQSQLIHSPDLVRRAEKLQVWTVNCNFKALKSYYKTEEAKAMSEIKKVQADIAPLLLALPKTLDVNFGEF